MKLILFFLVGSMVLLNNTLNLVNEFAFEGKSFESDHLGKVYSINDYSISIVDAQGKKTATYSDNTRGIISSMDVSNPMKIVVFFNETQQVIFLDNQLSLHGDPLDLFQLISRDIQLVAQSGSKNLWLYDRFENQIIQVDYFLNVTNKTGVLNGFLPNSFVPLKIIEKEEKLFVLSQNDGIAVFDIFGSFLYLLPLTNLSDFQIENNTIIYQEGNVLVFYNLITHQEEIKEFPCPKTAIIKKSGNRYQVLSQGTMKIYE